MIDRYDCASISDLWGDKVKYTKWLMIERAHQSALHAHKRISDSEWRSLCVAFDVQITPVMINSIKTIENKTKHDVAAFVEWLTVLGAGNYVHYGLTSSDIVDTGFNLILIDVYGEIVEKINKLLSILEVKAYTYKYAVCAGRTHGRFAETTTFGLKLANMFAELVRGRDRLTREMVDIKVGKLSGPVGNYTVTKIEYEAYALDILDLEPDKASTQVLSRDRYAGFMNAISVIGGTLERMGTEIRHLSRSEVEEVSESFAIGQIGSSSMPHKMNPIASENICGCSRLLRGYQLAVMENMNLWHERDISHSSVERVAFQDATVLLGYMLDKMKSIINGLNINLESMERNVTETYGTDMSGRLLAALIDSDVDRIKAHTMVAKISRRSMEERIDLDHIARQELGEMYNDEIYAAIAPRPDNRLNKTTVNQILERTFEE